MNVQVKPGKYVVAVSGGVDSVALLHILQAQPDLDLVIAHFDHGIRPVSAEDAQFVAQLAKKYGLAFVTERIELGADASEELARNARYDFLERVSCQHGDAPIILAHHQDDLLETAIHNLLRGTGRRGLTSLRSTEHLVRPLLDVSKQSLVEYALQQKLSWREDATNNDERYTRNYIRKRLLVHFDADARQQLLTIIEQLTAINDELDELLADFLAQHTSPESIDRRRFYTLEHTVSLELLAAWLRQRGLRDFTAQGLVRLAIGLKTLPAGKQLDILDDYFFQLSLHSARLRNRKVTP